MKTAQSKLEDAYTDALPARERICASEEDISGPLFLSIPEGYERTKVRLMIVGQQTHGWPDVSIGLDGLIQTYRDFDLAREYHSTPFWQASHQVNEGVNPDGPERSFLWTNLVRSDQGKERPNPEVENTLSELGLLEKEFELLAPDAAIFFTGPNYDDRIRQVFPGVEFHQESSDVARLTHPLLPARSFRTYHPGYLWRAKKRGVIDGLVEAILSN